MNVKNSNHLNYHSVSQSSLEFPAWHTPEKPKMPAQAKIVIAYSTIRILKRLEIRM